MIDFTFIMTLLLLFALMLVFYILTKIIQKLDFENQELEAKLKHLKEMNKVLKYEIQFQKTLSKTFSDGLEALTKNKK